MTFFGKKFSKQIKISLINDDYKIIYFNKAVRRKIKDNSGISWILNCSNGEGIEVFWITYNKEFVSGCHSF